LTQPLQPKKSNKIAVMGGSFDPFHLAHLNSLLTVKECFKLDSIILIPSFKTPLKNRKSSSSFHRLNMLKELIKSYPFLQVDTQELSRKGISYTYITIQELLKKLEIEKLFFIMGLDQFYIFDQWKNYEDILKKSHLIVTSRPGLIFPKKQSELPKKLQRLFKKKEVLKSYQKLSLKQAYKDIFFVPLKDMDISSSDIRKRIKKGQTISHLLYKKIESYIQKNKLYTKQEKSLSQTETLIQFVLEELKQKKAYDIKLYNLSSKPLAFSFGLIVSTSNTWQTKALAKHLKKRIKTCFKINPLNEEGKESSSWIVLDYHDIVLHIFYDYTRNFYNLEELWQSCEIKI